MSYSEFDFFFANIMSSTLTEDIKVHRRGKPIK